MTTSEKTSILTIRELTFEHQPAGLLSSVVKPQPRISWKFGTRSDLKDVEQTAYEIAIAPGILQDHDSKSDLYRVTSAESVLVPWPGKPLSSRGRRAVKIRAYCIAGGESLVTPWTDWHILECALLQRTEFVASFIKTSAAPESDGPLRPVRFRKNFDLPQGRGKLLKATLHITAQGVYEAFINGDRVGDHHMAPGWTSYKHRLNYQSFDVTALIELEVANSIAVEVAEGWFAGRLGWKGERYFYGKELATFAQLEIEFENDPVIFSIVSDGSWQCAPSAIVRSEIYDGELYDAQQEAADWHTGHFDSSSWASAIATDFPECALIASDAPPVRVTEEVKVVKIFLSKSGKKILDFGQNLVGKLSVKELDMPKGHQVSFTHAEVMENDELGVRPLRHAKCTDTIICSGEKVQNWTPKFTFHGFRYVQVSGWDEITEDSVRALVLHTDMRRTGYFSCSEPLVNKLHENTVWSMRGNFLSIPTDCPQRDERLGWTGDIQVFCPSANFLYDTSGMLSDWLKDLAVEQQEWDGVPPFVVPNVLAKTWGNFPQAVWDDVTILVPWELYQAFGDVEILKRQFPSMKAWIDKGVRRGPDGLWDRNTWQLGDWLDPIAPPERPDVGRTDGTYVADTYLVHVTEMMSKISHVIGETVDAARYTADFARYKELFSRRYVSPAGLVASDSQTGLALAIVFGLHEKPDQVQAAADQLGRHVRLAGFKVATGFAGTPIISKALSTVGLSQLAYRMLLEQECPSWLYPITMGATTIWERWNSMLPDGSINPGEMTSFNHYALGSVVNWLHTTVGGISPLKPGWRRILVRPVPGGTLTWAEASLESAYGLIKSRWEIEGNTFKLELEVPPNTKAMVILPNQQANVALGEEEKGSTVGSGRHFFSCEYRSENWPPKAIYPEIAEIQADLAEKDGRESASGRRKA